MSAPLNSEPPQNYKAVDQDVEAYYEEEWGFSPTTKKWLIGGGLTLSLAFIYLFCFVLPSMFIPDLIPLVGIAKVQELDVELVPVTQEVVASWRGDWLEQHKEDEEEVEMIEETYLEAASNKTKKARQRIILVGDIHGQYIQFRKLLRKVHYNKKTDHLLVLGDFIAKGPDSLKVLDYLVENNVDCILGNHEYYALQNYAQFHALESPHFVANSSVRTKHLELGAQGFIDDPEYLLAKKLQPHHVEYINRCGLIKKLGPVPVHSSRNTGRHNSAPGLAVHAGLRWDLTSDLNLQDPSDCLEMRSYLKPYFNETTDDPHAEGAVSWSKIWNSKSKNGTIPENYVVYYGHDARRGLNLKKWAKGLDNGCVRGDNLAAMVLWQEHSKRGVLYKEQAVTVKC